MTNAKATRRFFLAMGSGLVVFIAASVALSNLRETAGTALIITLVTIAILALASFFWAHLRFVSEVDEFLRSIQIRAIIFSLTVVFCLFTALGYISLFLDRETVSLFWLNPTYWLSYGAASLFLSWRETGTLG
tara:strand:+ start:192 stop:590 length:399 start_codon:yes stop_codon:yes gene_type:complete